MLYCQYQLTFGLLLCVCHEYEWVSLNTGVCCLLLYTITSFISFVRSFRFLLILPLYHLLLLQCNAEVHFFSIPLAGFDCEVCPLPLAMEHRPHKCFSMKFVVNTSRSGIVCCECVIHSIVAFFSRHHSSNAIVLFDHALCVTFCVSYFLCETNECKEKLRCY